MRARIAMLTCAATAVIGCSGSRGSPGSPARPQAQRAPASATASAGTAAPVGALSSPGCSPLGETLTPDGRYLLAAAGSGAVVISVARAEQGRPDAVIGTLTDPAGGAGAIEVAVSPDGRYAFVTQEDSRRAAVFNLQRALTQGFGAAGYVGAIPLGLAPVGMAVSPDGRWLYLTSEVASPPGEQGSLTVVGLPRAETDPAASVVATVAAGCNPVRVITSAGGSMVWVTARASDDLLGFSAAALPTAPSRALKAVVRAARGRQRRHPPGYLSSTAPAGGPLTGRAG